VKPGPRKNLAASVRRRLLNLARQRGEELQFLLTRFALERLLYRLSQSEYHSRFILKGATLFSLWQEVPHRPSWDLDLLGRGDAAPDHIVEVFRDLCRLPVEDDGMVYLADSVVARPIRKSEEYHGVRVLMKARLDSAVLPLQVDIGFGDAVTPPARTRDFPSLLDFPVPRLRVYPLESVVSEKFEAMVSLDLDNSRMKDFYDLWLLAGTFTFEEAPLCRAIAATFKRRGTPLPEALPPAWTADFHGNAIKQVQWAAFLRKSRLTAEPLSLADVTAQLQMFLLPPVRTIREDGTPHRSWPAGGPWSR